MTVVCTNDLRYTENTSDAFRKVLATRMQYPSNMCVGPPEGELAHTISTEITSLERDDVILAIAAVWQGVAGANLFYSFGNDARFEFAKAMLRPEDTQTEETVAPNSDTLIIPLDSGTLAIAISEPSNENLVRFIFFQSGAGKASRHRRDVRAIVKYCGWLPEDSDPRFVNSLDQWVTAPTAVRYNDVDTAAHHVVLNAWAYMLDIPISKAMRDLNKEAAKEFYSTLQSLMNMAYCGRLDRELVRAFMHEYGYAEKTINPGGERRTQDTHQRELLEHARSVLINPQIFAVILAMLHEDPNTRHIETTFPPAILLDPSIGPVPPVLGPTVPRVGLPPTNNGTARSNAKAATSWRQILDNNLRIFERKARALPKGDESVNDRRRITVSDNHYYGNTEVEAAIHCLWYPLLKQQLHPFAMGTGTTYGQRSLNLAKSYRNWTVGDRSMPFIMPIRGKLPTFEDAFGANPGMHWILAIAEMDKTVDQQVNIRILNSYKRATAAMRKATEEIVRYSGWLGVESDRLAPLEFKVLTFTHDTPTVPEQHEKLSCGFHVVMSAWAIMLGIPIHPHRKLRKYGTERAEFYKMGTRVINCALAGCMNSRTMQALLNEYGFSIDQPLTERCIDIELTRVMTERGMAEDHWEERDAADAIARVDSSLLE